MKRYEIKSKKRRTFDLGQISARTENLRKGHKIKENIENLERKRKPE